MMLYQHRQNNAANPSVRARRSAASLLLVLLLLWCRSAQAARVCILDSGSSLPGASGWNVLEANESITDTTGHGTALHALVTSLAPTAEVVIIKCFDDRESSNEAALAKALYTAIDHQADVILMSWTNTAPGDALHEAIKAAQAAGAVLVASCGNLSLATGVGQVCYPAAWPEVLGIAGAMLDETGLPVQSLWYLTGAHVFACADGAWQGEYGASYAAARVAALAALLLDKGETDIPQALVRQAQDVGTPGWDQVFGWGYLKIEEAQ